MFVLVKDNVAVQQLASISRIDLPNGDVVMGATAGAELGEYSLYEIIPADEVPEGKMVSETRVEFIDGVWTFVNTLVDILVSVPEEISRRQFFQQLAVLEIITKPEALAAMQTGAIPAAVQTIVDTLPAESQFEAQMLITGAQVFHLNNPLSEVVRMAMGWTEEQKKQFWIEAAIL